METIETFERNRAEELVRKRVHAMRNFYIHLVVYAIALLTYVLQEYGGVDFHFRPLGYLSTFVMVIWTVILVMDAIKVFVTGVLLGKKWEDRKIKELMQNKTQKQIWK